MIVAISSAVLLLLRLIGFVATHVDWPTAEHVQTISPEQQAARTQVRAAIDAAAPQLRSTDPAMAGPREDLQTALDRAVDAYGDADVDDMHAAIAAVEAASSLVPTAPVPGVADTAPPPDAVAVRDLAVARPGDTRGDYANYLAAVHADGVYLSLDYAPHCGELRGDSRWLQACVPRVGVDDPGVIYVKEVAAGAVPGVFGKFLALHTYSHVLQARVGIGDVEMATDALFGAGRGVEDSADCMAFELGAVRSPDTEMTDCAGARGDLARAILAGHL
jgi:hypothetical protein